MIAVIGSALPAPQLASVGGRPAPSEENASSFEILLARLGGQEPPDAQRENGNRDLSTAKAGERDDPLDDLPADPPLSAAAAGVSRIGDLPLSETHTETVEAPQSEPPALHHTKPLPEMPDAELAESNAAPLNCEQVVAEIEEAVTRPGSLPLIEGAKSALSPDTGLKSTAKAYLPASSLTNPDWPPPKAPKPSPVAAPEAPGRRSTRPSNEPTFTKPVEERLFAFDELGMFGLHGAQDMASDLASLTYDLQEAASSPGATGGETYAAPYGVAMGENIQASSEAVAPLEPVSRNDMPPSLIQRLQGLLAQSPALASAELKAVDASEPRSAAPRIRPVSLTALNRSQVNIVVSQSGNGLVVTARGVGVNGEEALRLRRLLDDAAREFGMDLAELRVNGGLISREGVFAMGGAYGGRRR